MIITILLLPLGHISFSKHGEVTVWTLQTASLTKIGGLSPTMRLVSRPIHQLRPGDWFVFNSVLLTRFSVQCSSISEFATDFTGAAS
jgi:hypothetical protein